MSSNEPVSQGCKFAATAGISFSECAIAGKTFICLVVVILD